MNREQLETLKKAVISNRSDRSALLVLADAWMAHGNEFDKLQGEFVVVNHEMSGEKTNSPTKEALQDRRNNLNKKRRDFWKENFGPNVTLLLDEDGYASGIRFSRAKDKQKIRAWWDQHKKALSELLGCMLNIWDMNSLTSGCEIFTELVTSPTMSTLQELWAKSNQITSEHAKALASSPTMAMLTFLRLSENPIGNEGAYAIAASPYLRNLSELLLDQCDIGDSAIAFTESDSMKNLFHLDLSSNQLTYHAESSLQACPHLRKGVLETQDAKELADRYAIRRAYGFGDPEQEKLTHFRKERRRKTIVFSE
jgi:hypothetical protein